MLPEKTDKIILYRERNFFLSSIKPIPPANKTVRTKVTVSFRMWKKPGVKTGGTLLTPVGQLRIDSVKEMVEPILPDLEEESLSSIAEVANVSPEKLRKLWVKANGRCQCFRIAHGHGIPCGKKLRPDGSDWVCCDLYTFPRIPGTLTEVAMKEDAIICWECYDWKLDIDWDKLYSRPMT